MCICIKILCQLDFRPFCRKTIATKKHYNMTLNQRVQSSSLCGVTDCFKAFKNN